MRKNSVTQDNQNAGFVAGTLVHTDKGLVPIQDLKVGDRVLSKPEDGTGETSYKAVLSNFKSHHKEKIYKVEYYNKTADERGEKGLNYIFCSAQHPFWVSKVPTIAINANLDGEWLAAEDLPAGHLSSAHGDALWLDDYSYLPVRTLPNFPKGCAYVQSIDYHDVWEDEKYGGTLSFLRFTKCNYHYISLSPDADEETRKEHHFEFSIRCNEAKEFLSESNNFLTDKELFRMLSMRFKQDIESEWFSSDIFREDCLSPVIIDDKVARENRIVGKKGMQVFKRRLTYIDKYGDPTGLTKGYSIHHSMEKYYDDCPNSYEDYIYNIEIADNDTYFVGHDGIWAHGVA